MDRAADLGLGRAVGVGIAVVVDVRMVARVHMAVAVDGAVGMHVLVFMGFGGQGPMLVAVGVAMGLLPVVVGMAVHGPVRMDVGVLVGMILGMVVVQGLSLDPGFAAAAAAGDAHVRFSAPPVPSRNRTPIRFRLP